MKEWLAKGSIGDAVYEMENAALNAEQTIYLWTHFEATPRRLMKDEQKRLRKAAAEKGKITHQVIAAPQNGTPQNPEEAKLSAGTTPSGSMTDGRHLAADSHPAGAAPDTISDSARKRLEARISELKLDREGVKKYVKDNFGKDHFAEMTKDEYDKLDKLIEIRAMKRELEAAQQPVSDV
jgi:hypothetical protein